jgi:hypothetical protein
MEVKMDVYIVHRIPKTLTEIVLLCGSFDRLVAFDSSVAIATSSLRMTSDMRILLR